MNVYTRVRRTAMYSWPGSTMRNLPLCTPASVMVMFHVSMTSTRQFRPRALRNRGSPGKAEAVVVNLVAGDGDHLVRHGDGLIKCAGALL